MSNDNRKNVYRDAYEAATLELAEIVSAFDQLCEQKSRIEELLTALEPDAKAEAEADSGAAQQEVAVAAAVNTANLKPLMHRGEGFSVATHCSAVWSKKRKK